MNLSGLCMCECGQPAPIATVTDPSRDYVKGQPMKYIFGHTKRLYDPATRYTEEDRGYETPCWMWSGPRTKQRYPRYRINGRYRGVHRWMYEQQVGPIPEGLELDHLCSQTFCINPAHLEPVTHVENVRRGRLTNLTADLVRAMRVEDAAHLRQRASEGKKRRADGWLTHLSVKYGIGWTGCRQILDPKKGLWKEVPF